LPESDLRLLIAAAEAAGVEAMRFWRNNPKSWEKPDGAGPVSDADLAVNRMLAQHLRGARPDYGWLSEEDPDEGERDSAAALFIVDPIDGTRAFLAGEEIFAISVAVVRRGVSVAGVVHLPARQRTYAAVTGGAALLNGQPIQASAWSGREEPKLLTSAYNLQAEYWPGGLPRVRRTFRPSIAYRLCLVAEGAMDATLTLRPSWEWDIAAGALIAERAGAVVTDRKGGALNFNTRPPLAEGLLAAGPRLHADLLARLRG
jgi:myo-inositol-1(or 4)-monophosphatase